MRPDILRTYKTLHTWTGIVTGMVLFIAFYAGALTMFEAPLTRWASPPGAVTPTGIGRADELMVLTLAVRPEIGREFTLHLGDAAEVPARLTWRKSVEDATQWSSALEPDGSVRLTRLRPSGLGQLIDDLHRTGGIPGDPEIGTMVMGVVSGVYVLALVSGVVLVLPSLLRDLFALCIGPNLKRLWMDAHNLVGIFSLPFHLVIALTAVVFGLHDEIYDTLNKVVYESRLQEVMRADSPFSAIKPNRQPAAMLPVDALVQRVKERAPGFEPFSLQYRGAGTKGAIVRVWGYDHRYLMRGKGFVMMSPVTGEVVNTEYLPGQQGTWAAMVAAFFALHFGSFGGELMRWSYLVLGLSGAFLFYSGNLLWIESRRRTERRHGASVQQSRSTRLMASATVGICLGAMFGLSLTIVAGRWLHGMVADLNAWHRGIYYAAWAGALAWAFYRGAARAAIYLLWLAAAATAAIPLTSLIGWMVPAFDPWPSAAASSPAIDAIALAGAAAFAWAARATTRRAEGGAADSVWSAPKADGEPEATA